MVIHLILWSPINNSGSLLVVLNLAVKTFAKLIFVIKENVLRSTILIMSVNVNWAGVDCSVIKVNEHCDKKFFSFDLNKLYF